MKKKRAITLFICVALFISILSYVAATQYFFGSVVFNETIQFIPSNGDQRIIAILQDVINIGPQNGAIHIDNSENTGHAITLYSNQDSSADGSLVRLWADNPTFDKPALWIFNKGDSGSASGIRIDGSHPEIEFYETDQQSPQGIFELRINNGKFQIGTRKADDSGFEYPYTFLQQAAEGANFGIQMSNPKRNLHIKDTMRLEPRNSPPSSPKLGDLYVDSNTKELCFYNGNNWIGLTANELCV